MEPKILVSVVIPVKNGEGWLDETIQAILNQQIEGNFEIVVLDSGSTDGTLRLLSKYPVTIIHIKPEEFNHGLTRSKGANLANGKYVVMTVQDAKPVSSFWLQQLLSGFIDNTVAGVCGQQIVPHHPDMNPAEWYRPVSKPELRKYHFANTQDFKNLSFEEQLAICRWDDVNAMYRKDILNRLPFEKTDFAEDVLWAKSALQEGYAIVYNPLAQVEHYHHGNYKFAFKRNFITNYHFYKYFGVFPPENRNLILEILRVIKLLVMESGISFIQKWKWFKYNIYLLRAIRKSNGALLEGIRNNNGAHLDILYRKICQSIPQAFKHGQ